MNVQRSFDQPGTAYPVTQRHIREAWNRLPHLRENHKPTRKKSVVFASLACGSHDIPHIHLFGHGGLRAVVNSWVQYEEYNGACNYIALFIYIEITETPNDL
jgi:hypothetical protein